VGPESSSPDSFTGHEMPRINGRDGLEEAEEEQKHMDHADRMVRFRVRFEGRLQHEAFGKVPRLCVC